MTDSTFHSLEEAIADEHFPEVDLMLRRGRHIGRDDGTIYDYLVDAQALLEGFYGRFGCELVQQSDGYFYLLPLGDRLGRRQLSAGEMLVGQTLALLYLDPCDVTARRASSARDALLQRLVRSPRHRCPRPHADPRKRKYDERIAAETVRAQVGEALRRLADLGFVDILDETHLRLRPALLRFAEPVRGLTDPNAALERLVARGEVLLGEARERRREEPTTRSRAP